MCHDSRMDEGVAAELRALRNRAYAPGGDIADDPVALARLTELEERERERRLRHAHEHTPDPKPELPPTIDTAPNMSALGSDEAGDDASRGHDSQGHESQNGAVDTAAPRGRQPRSLRSIFMWAGSLVAVAALAVGITVFATARSASTATALPPDARVSHVTTLLPTGAELPEFFRGYDRNGEGRSFEPFLGLAVFETPSFWSLDEGESESCVIVTRVADVESSTSDSWSGFMDQGCSAGAFPAAVSFVVHDDQPEDLLARYPVGTAMQLVLTDAGVDVFVSEAPTSSAAPEAPGGATGQPAG